MLVLFKYAVNDINFYINMKYQISKWQEKQIHIKMYVGSMEGRVEAVFYHQINLRFCKKKKKTK